MKNFFSFIFLFYFIYINCDNSICNYQIDVESKEDCQNIIDIDKDFKCCYVQYTYNDEEEDKDVEVKKCHAIKDNLEDINDYYKGIKLYSNNKVLCYSNFISIQPMLLLFILFNFIFVI